jgi:hypothetical protein
MSTVDPLDDLTIRQRQLEKHLLRSPEYLRRADQDLKRQVAILYLAIALLLVFQGIFVLREAGRMPDGLLSLIVFTAILAIVNCLLLIRTKRCLHRLNEGWLDPHAKRTLEALKLERARLQPEKSASGDERPIGEAS